MMNKIISLRQRLLVLIGLSAFALFGIFGVPGGAQTMRSTKATPTPKKTVKATPKGMAPKKSPASTSSTPKPTAKATPKPTPKTTPKPAESPQIIVSVTSARLRSEPSTSSETLQYLKIGAVYSVLDQNTGWYRIRAGSEKTGWISNTVSQPFTSAKRGEIYGAIAAKYSKQSLDFATASQLYDFLTTAEKQITNRRQQGEIGFKRLLALQTALKKIPYDKQEMEPYKTFLKDKDKEVIYSDPSAEFYVISELFWDLHDKNKGTPIGEDIAWTASQNSLPGECEGYINCYLHNLRVTYGEYLNFYPAGKYSKKALTELGVFLGPIVADSREKSVYSGPADISDRAEFNKLLTELRAIVSRSPYTEKTKPLQQIKTLAEAYR